MADSTLTWVNVFTKDLEALPQFYMDVFGFREVPEMRNDYFRGLDTGRSALGFMSRDVYGILQLDGHEDDEGIKLLLNVDVPTMDEVDRLTPVAVERGAVLVKAPAKTSYGWYQAALLDPEQNVFRINTVVDGYSI
jgi:predicted enzyme related to lactoylglutathione lyase